MLTSKEDILYETLARLGVMLFYTLSKWGDLFFKATISGNSKKQRSDEADENNSNASKKVYAKFNLNDSYKDTSDVLKCTTCMREVDNPSHSDDSDDSTYKVVDKVIESEESLIYLLDCICIRLGSSKGCLK